MALQPCKKNQFDFHFRLLTSYDSGSGSIKNQCFQKTILEKILPFYIESF